MDIRYPLQPQPSIAAFTGSCEFDPGDAETAALPAYMLPQAVSHAWKPLFPVVVYTGPSHGTLTDRDRDLIWRNWGVPVYEHIVDGKGRTIAAECDVHDGLHVLPGASWGGPVEQRRCFCGVAGPMALTQAVALQDA